MLGTFDGTGTLALVTQQDQVFEFFASKKSQHVVSGEAFCRLVWFLKGLNLSYF